MTEQLIMDFASRKQQLDQEYAAWSEMPGARHIKKHCYRITAAYVTEWRKSRIPVSFSMIWELVRHLVKHRLSRMERLAVDASKWDGYSLPNNFRGRLTREIMEKRPDWAGIFEIHKS